nr:S24 family peptidase [Pseudescherichia vulneris]
MYGHEEDANVGPAPVTAQQIPIISYVQAGAWSPECDARNLDGTVDYILTSEFHSLSTFALKVKGKSMEPDFVEGDVIIVDPELHPGPGDFVVAKNGSDEATFKKYRARGVSETGEEIFELIPLNEDYAVRNSAKEKIRIVGVVVEHRRMMRRTK